MNFNFRIRCSAIGSIMGGTVGITEKQKQTIAELKKKQIEKREKDKDITENQKKTLADLEEKAKNLALPAGAKTYCDNWLMEQIYSRRKEISNKYCDKGNQMEDVAIEIIERELNLPWCVKNEEFFRDAYFMGTPDLILPAEIIDTKCSYDFTTFPLMAYGLKNQDYAWQVLGYCHLTGKRSARVVYVLTDTPAEIIEQEARSLHFRQGFSLDEARAKATKLGTYPDIPAKLKVRAFTVPYDQAKVDAIIERVKLCQEYVNQRVHELKEGGRL